MSDIDVEIGPIDYLVVEWPPGQKPTGEALPMLVDLVERGLIRIYDLAFLQKEEDGTIVRIELRDMGSDPELTVFEGASSNLLGDDDLREAAAAIEPGSSAALLVYENSWAAPFATALRRGGARLVANGRIPINELIATLDDLDREERS
jgi:dihydroorotase-like cyclic amidohydrolase